MSDMEIFGKKDTVWFVSGSGISAPGGCTQAWFEAQSSPAAAMAKLVGADGAAIATAGGASVSSRGSGEFAGLLQITKSGAFVGAEAGMVAYCDFSGTYADGRYEILEVLDSGTLVIELVYSTNAPTVNVVIGGAFSSIRNADLATTASRGEIVIAGDSAVSNGSGKVRLNDGAGAGGFQGLQAGDWVQVEFESGYANGYYKVIGTNPYSWNWIDIDLDYSSERYVEEITGRISRNVTIYTHTDELFASRWAVGTGCGDYRRNTWKKFIGFSAVPGDRGQVTLSGGGALADHVVHISNLDNLRFENIIIANNTGNYKYGVNIESSSGHSYNLVFRHCTAHSCYDGWFGNTGSGGAVRAALLDCQAHHNRARGFDFWYIAAGQVNLIGCSSYENSLCGAILSHGAAYNCAFYDNGQYGILGYYGMPLYVHCVAAGNGRDGILNYANEAAGMVLVNTIAAHNGESYAAVSLAPGKSGSWGGSVAEAYNCFSGGAEGLAADESTLTSDPRFLDGSNADWRLSGGSVCRDAGFPDRQGDGITMGLLYRSPRPGGMQTLAGSAITGGF